MIFRDLIQNGSRLATENAPALLTAFGAVGTVTTAVLAAKGGFDAADIIRTHHKDLNADWDPDEGDELVVLSKTEMLKLTWLCYLPAAATGVVTVSSIILAHTVSSRRAAVIAAAYALNENKLDEYQDKIKEKFGIKKENDAREEIVQDQVNRHAEGIVFGGIEGKVIIHDEYSGRFFWSTVEEVNKAVNIVNREINQNNSATSSDFYDVLDLAHVTTSDEFGWNSAEALELVWTTCKTPNDGPAAHSFAFLSQPILRPWAAASFH